LVDLFISRHSEEDPTTLFSGPRVITPWRRASTPNTYCAASV